MCAEDYIADRLVDLCEKRGLTKYRLAQLTGMSQTAIGSIISKESIPTIPTLEKLCSAFGITLAQFFSNEESHPNLTETQREKIEFLATTQSTYHSITDFILNNIAA